MLRNQVAFVINETMQAPIAIAVPTAKPGRKPPLEQRARSVPYKKPFIRAILISASYYLALIGTAAALFSFFAQPTRTTGVLLAGFSASALVLWLLSYAARRHAHCPLCKGTPFLDNSAHYHEKAFRFFPLNHGTSNLIRSIACQNFRCQFCGTPFDLAKPVLRHHGGSERPTP